MPAFWVARLLSGGNIKNVLFYERADLRAVIAELKAAKLKILAHSQERKYVAPFGHKGDSKLATFAGKKQQARNIAPREQDIADAWE